MLRVNLLALVLATVPAPAFAAAFTASPQGAGGGPPAQDVLPQGIPAHWFGPGPLHTVRLTLEELLALPAGALVRSQDYGSFVQAVVDERAFGGADGLRAAQLDVRDEQDLLVFNDIVLLGTRPELTLRTLDPSQLFTDPATLQLPADAGLYVVQFDGPPRDAWLDAVLETGARIVQPVPMNAYVVAAEPGAAAALAALQVRAPFVQYVGAYEP